MLPAYGAFALLKQLFLQQGNGTLMMKPVAAMGFDHVRDKVIKADGTLLCVTFLVRYRRCSK